MFTVSRFSLSAKIIRSKHSCQGEESTHWVLSVLLQSLRYWPPHSWQFYWRHAAESILIYRNHLPLVDHCYQCSSCTVHCYSNQNWEEIDNRAEFDNWANSNWRWMAKSEYKTSSWSYKDTCQNQRLKRCVLHHCCFHNSTFSGHQYYRAKCMAVDELQICLVHFMFWRRVYSALHFWSGLDFSFGTLLQDWARHMEGYSLRSWDLFTCDCFTVANFPRHVYLGGVYLFTYSNSVLHAHIHLGFVQYVDCCQHRDQSYPQMSWEESNW